MSLVENFEAQRECDAVGYQCEICGCDPCQCDDLGLEDESEAE